MTEAELKDTIKRIYLELLDSKGVAYAEKFRRTIICDTGDPLLSLEALPDTVRLISKCEKQ